MLELTIGLIVGSIAGFVLGILVLAWLLRQPLLALSQTLAKNTESRDKHCQSLRESAELLRESMGQDRKSFQ